jgi:hypothetical protein
MRFGDRKICKTRAAGCHIGRWGLCVGNLVTIIHLKPTDCVNELDHPSYTVLSGCVCELGGS